MHNILLFNADGGQFDFTTINRVFQSANGFRDVRFDEPGGRVIEADYGNPDDSTIIGLSGDLKRISLSGTSDAALRAALILQQNLAVPLRMVDTEYSFDLTFQNISDVEELRNAIDEAHTD
jgi:hypothetical protein